MRVHQTTVIFIVFIILGITFQGGMAIKCWVCRSNIDPKCADPFDNSTMLTADCNFESELENLPGVKPTMCRKLRQTENGRTVISRSCEWPRSNDDTVGKCSQSTFNTPSYIKVEFCETCDFDGCNDAAVIYSLGIWKTLPSCVGTTVSLLINLVLIRNFITKE